MRNSIPHLTCVAPHRKYPGAANGIGMVFALHFVVPVYFPALPLY